MNRELSDNPKVRAALAQARAQMDAVIADARAYVRWRDERIASISDTAMRAQVIRSIEHSFSGPRAK